MLVQVEKSVADLGRHGFTLRTLLTPKAARAAEQQAHEQALHSQDSDRMKQQLELQAGLEGCGFNPAQLQGVMALDDIEEIVAQVREREVPCAIEVVSDHGHYDYD
jgi:hypothetical protein